MKTWQWQVPLSQMEDNVTKHTYRANLWVEHCQCVLEVKELQKFPH